MKDNYDIVALVSQFGFPIVVTLYLLSTTNKRLDKLTSVVERLAGKISMLVKRELGD